MRQQQRGRCIVVQWGQVPAEGSADGYWIRYRCGSSAESNPGRVGNRRAAEVQWVRQENGQAIRSQGRRQAGRDRYKPGDQESGLTGTRVQGHRRRCRQVSNECRGQDPFEPEFGAKTASSRAHALPPLVRAPVRITVRECAAIAPRLRVRAPARAKVPLLPSSGRDCS